MPIYEFRCLKCGAFVEKLLTRSDEEFDLVCSECHSDAFERVVSRTNYVMGAGPGGNQPKITTKSCGGSNQCMTLDLPGPSR